MSLVIYEVPSKCRFDLIQTTLEHVQNGKTAKELAEATAQHIRHAHLLLQNADILGFIGRKNSNWVLTDSGLLFLRSNNTEKKLLIAKAMVSSNLFRFLLERSGSFAKAKKMSIQQISELLLMNTIISKGSIEPIQKSTATRRAASVKGWLNWLSATVGNALDDPRDELVLAEQETLDYFE
jgi:hypothetical protein